MHDPADLWFFLPIGYALSVLLETPVLLLLLSRPHSWSRRLFAGLMLTACTYPIVALVMPLVIKPWFESPERGHFVYVAIAEIFAPLAECLLFYLVFDREELAAGRLKSWQVTQDCLAVVAANLCSWLVGAQIADWLL